VAMVTMMFIGGQVVAATVGGRWLANGGHGRAEVASGW